jgi:hypothetical protein
MAFHYELVTHTRAGAERTHAYVSESALEPGSVLRLEGRDWLVEEVEDSRVIAKPARYRLVLRHPDGEEETGGFRRWRPDAPRIGHAFATIEDDQPVSWEVVDQRLHFDDEGEPYLEFVAERDYDETDGDLPPHELEHTSALDDEDVPEGARAMLAQATAAGFAVELLALEPGEAPDWDEAQRYLDALTFEEIEDDLFEMGGVDTRHDPQDTWLPKLKERLRSDLESFRADIEGDHDEIEEWDFRDGRIFASVGTIADESDPDKGHGWLTRLLDAGVTLAAGFRRVRKGEIG